MKKSLREKKLRQIRILNKNKSKKNKIFHIGLNINNSESYISQKNLKELEEKMN